MSDCTTLQILQHWLLVYTLQVSLREFDGDTVESFVLFKLLFKGSRIQPSAWWLAVSNLLSQQISLFEKGPTKGCTLEVVLKKNSIIMVSTSWWGYALFKLYTEFVLLRSVHIAFIPSAGNRRKTPSVVFLLVFRILSGPVGTICQPYCKVWSMEGNYFPKQTFVSTVLPWDSWVWMLQPNSSMKNPLRIKDFWA